MQQADYLRDASQIRSSKKIPFISCMSSTLNKRQTLLLEHPIIAKVRFLYVQYTLKTHCAHDTDMIDKLNASKTTSVSCVLAAYMIF